jgi:hypothetical protein
MKNMSFWKRASTYTKIKDSIAAVGSIAQVVFVAADFAHIYNYVTFGVQLIGTFITIWFEDRNKNDVPDIFEKEVTVTVKSEAPVDVQVTKEEINPK